MIDRSCSEKPRELEPSRKSPASRPPKDECKRVFRVPSKTVLSRPSYAVCFLPGERLLPAAGPAGAVTTTLLPFLSV